MLVTLLTTDHQHQHLALSCMTVSPPWWRGASASACLPAHLPIGQARVLDGLIRRGHELPDQLLHGRLQHRQQSMAVQMAALPVHHRNGGVERRGMPIGHPPPSLSFRVWDDLPFVVFVMGLFILSKVVGRSTMVPNQAPWTCRETSKGGTETLWQGWQEGGLFLPRLSLNKGGGEKYLRARVQAMDNWQPDRHGLA